MSEQKMNEEMTPSSPELGQKRDDFYIGWKPQAPASISKHTKRVLLVLFPAVLVLGFLLAANQKKFSSATFEFGSLTRITGIYMNKPVPSVRVANGKNLWNTPSYITIPLVGFGKHGAGGIIESIQKEKKIDFTNREITLKGTLLYNDGKLLMQIDGNDTPLVATGNTRNDISITDEKELGVVHVKGEIVDPKCFFGVMKPGEGKVHKDCAIRCILGGISPVLKVQNEKGAMNYYLLAGTGGVNINEGVKDFVAEPVEIEATAVQQGDWIVLYTNKEKIRRISRIELVYPSMLTISCQPNCIK